MPRILSGDPGTRNFSITVMDINRSLPKILDCVFFEDIIFNLSNHESEHKDESYLAYPDQLSITVKKIRKFLNTWKPDLVAFERFQTRGPASRGKTIELVTTMNAIWTTLAYTKKVTPNLIIAAEWKNMLNRKCKEVGGPDVKALEHIYQEAKSLYPVIEPHNLDSTFIGMYVNDRESLNKLSSLKNRKTIYRQLAKCLT